MSLFLASCHRQSELKKHSLTGNAQGTYYSIIYYAYTQDLTIDIESGIDSILNLMDQNFSTYVENSLINQFNQSGILLMNEHFIEMITKSERICKETNGSFDPTVGPLVDGYGFGPDGLKAKLEKDSIEKLRTLVGFNKLIMRGDTLIKADSGMKINFNGIAQGYTVDIICNYFNKRGFDNYLVDVGGEIRVKGEKPKQENWILGIDKPIEGNSQRKLQHKIMVTDISLATSGNYRKYYIEEGKKVTHTIDPGSGKPVISDLLSASVFMSNCAEADAYATAFMVMGKDRSISFVEQREDLEVILIYGDADGKMQSYISPGLTKRIIQD